MNIWIYLKLDIGKGAQGGFHREGVLLAGCFYENYTIGLTDIWSQGIWDSLCQLLFYLYYDTKIFFLKSSNLYAWVPVIILHNNFS